MWNSATHGKCHACGKVQSAIQNEILDANRTSISEKKSRLKKNSQVIHPLKDFNKPISLVKSLSRWMTGEFFFNCLIFSLIEVLLGSNI